MIREERKKYLTKRAKELNKLDDEELQELFAQAQKKSVRPKRRWIRI